MNAKRQDHTVPIIESFYFTLCQFWAQFFYCFYCCFTRLFDTRLVLNNLKVSCFCVKMLTVFNYKLLNVCQKIEIELN